MKIWKINRIMEKGKLTILGKLSCELPKASYDKTDLFWFNLTFSKT